eukprot:Gregarina_sp_Pseudo_9__3074@NODE_326_length_3153_cov_14_414579_g306_i0_p2_GENE_NODE_326_length_3153_cov_14_414579_g306_i0NODE_326_length_3153_cov_14_414579_g306_i0_p2_ORF_typecomplete_len417_score117_96RRM_1/PF00076_22/0_0015RRM_1/PF00076_22/3_6e03_NODE_326_length_3153_cov_14_414579_g306_i018373087
MTSTAPYPRVVNPMYGGGGDAETAGAAGAYGRSGGVLSHRLVVCLTPENPALHLSFIDGDVASVFNLCGPIRQCHTFIHPPRVSHGPSLPFAVVDFYSGPAAAEAVTSLNGTVLPNLGTIQIHRLLPEESVEEKVQRVFASYLGSIGEQPAMHASGLDMMQQAAPLILPAISRSGHSIGGSPAQNPLDPLKQVQTTDGQTGVLPDNGSSINAAEALKQLANLLHQIPPKQQPPSQQPNAQSSPFQPASFPGGRPASAMYLARMEFVDLFGVEGFDVTSAVLGDRDRNIHFILEQADHKVSISLKGVPANDAPVAERLHMAITSSSKPHFERAVDMAEDLLRAVCHKVVSLCAQRRLKASPNVGFIKHLYVGDQTPDGMGTNFRYQGNVRHVNPAGGGGGGGGGVPPANTSKRMRGV